MNRTSIFSELKKTVTLAIPLIFTQLLSHVLPVVDTVMAGREPPAVLASVALEPADAFGEHDAALVTTMAKADFPPGVKVGGQLQDPGPSGLPVLYRVVKIKGPVVHVDGNAPLAGRAIRFAATVKAVCARPRLRKSPTATCMARMGISTDASFFAPPRPSKRERSLA